VIDHTVEKVIDHSVEKIDRDIVAERTGAPCLPDQIDYTPASLEGNHRCGS
jgi:hypothetical protein